MRAYFILIVLLLLIAKACSAHAGEPVPTRQVIDNAARANHCQNLTGNWQDGVKLLPYPESCFDKIAASLTWAWGAPREERVLKRTSLGVPIVSQRLTWVVAGHTVRCEQYALLTDSIISVDREWTR